MKEKINRSLLDKDPITLKEMIDVVESYIYDRKSVVVNINIPNHPFEIMKLQKAFWNAFKYYKTWK